jgi:hypothetical protein
MWIRFLFKAAPRVQSAFEKTNICLLQPSSSDNQYAGHACMSSVQCASGKKAFELEFMKWEVVMAPVAIETIHTCEEHIILSANLDTSCDLLIQSACFDLVKNTMVVPIQELKSVMQKQKQAGKGDNNWIHDGGYPELSESGYKPWTICHKSDPQARKTCRRSKVAEEGNG